MSQQQIARLAEELRQRYREERDTLLAQFDQLVVTLHAVLCAHGRGDTGKANALCKELLDLEHELLGDCHSEPLTELLGYAEELDTPAPWVIATTAVDDYRRIVGRPQDDPESVTELRALAQLVVGKAPKQLATGELQWRTGRPLRLRLIVKPAAAGAAAQLVRVLADHDQRSGSYTRSAPERSTGHDKRHRRA